MVQPFREFSVPETIAKRDVSDNYMYTIYFIVCFHPNNIVMSIFWPRVMKLDYK